MKIPHAGCIALLLGSLAPTAAMADETLFAPGCIGSLGAYFYSTGCDNVPEVGMVDGAVRVLWPGSDPGCRTNAGFSAEMYVDVAGMSEATLGLDVTLVSHSGCPAGSNIEDIPVLITIGYGAEGGVNGTYTHGFFIDGAENCSQARNVEGIPGGIAFSYQTPNLMDLPDHPTVIAWVEVTVAGYEYDARFDNLCVRVGNAPGDVVERGESLKQGSEAMSWGSVKALFR